MPLSQQDFVTTYGPFADEIAGETGLDRTVVLGLMAHESNFGNQFVGNNPFGIMRGNSVASYPSVGDAGRAFINLMGTDRYRGVSTLKPADQPTALRSSGYNSADPGWLPGVNSRIATITSLSAPKGQTQAPSTDDVRKLMDTTTPAQTPPSQPAAQPGAQPAAPPAVPSADDVRKQMNVVAPGPPKPDMGPVTAGPGGPSTFPTPAPTPPAATPPTDQKGPTGSAAIAAAPASEGGGALLTDEDPGVQAAKRIIQAGIDGYKGTEPLLTPYGLELEQKYVDPALGFLSPLVHSAANWLDVGRRAIGGATSAGLQTIYEAGSALGGPSLGRDLTTMATVAPLAPEVTFPTTRIPGKALGPEGVPAPPAKPPNFLDSTMATREGEIRSPAGVLGTIPQREVPTPSAPTATSTPVPEVPASGAAPTLGSTASVTNTVRTLLRQLGYSDPDIDAMTPGLAADIIKTDSRVGPPQQPAARVGEERLQRPTEQRAQPNAPDEHHETQEVDSEDAAPSAGAAGTPRGQIPSPSPASRARDLRMSIDQSAYDRAPNLIDNDAHVTDIPGGTLPERPHFEKDFSPLNALDQKVAYADPAHREATDAIHRERNSGMVELLKSEAGDDVTLGNARDYRRAASPDAMGVFRNEQPVDAQNIVNGIDARMRGPEGKTPAVQRTLQTVRDMMHDQDGNLETAPSQLYGAKQAIDNLLDKAAKPGAGTDREATDAAASARQLRAIRQQINDKIQEGAPRYSEYRQEYRNRSQVVNQQTFLQRYFQGNKNIVGSDGYLQLPKIKQMLEDIYKDMKDPRDRLAKSLTDKQIQDILNVRNELAAKKFANDQAAVRGADTFQQLRHTANTGEGTMARVLVHSALTGAHGVAVMAAGVNPLLHGMVETGRAAYEFSRPARELRAAQKAAARMAEETARRRAELLDQGPAMRMGGPYLPYSPEGFSRVRPGKRPVPSQGNLLNTPPP